MSLVGDLFGAGGVSNLLGTVVDKIWPDPAKAAEAKAALLQAQQAGLFKEMDQTFELQLEQIKTNAAEAANPNIFVAGWRPFVGWICGFGLGYAAIFEPMGRFIAVTFFDYKGTFPVLDTTITMQALFGILGLGAMRTYDKVKGVDNGH